jgi:hypothetical protein
VRGFCHFGVYVTARAVIRSIQNADDEADGQEERVAVVKSRMNKIGIKVYSNSNSSVMIETAPI